MKDAEAANVILGEAGEGDKFTLKYGIFKLRLSIKPVTARDMIRISREVCKISAEIDMNDAMFPQMAEQAGGLKYVCRSIAIATGTPYVRLVSRAISRLSLKDIFKLWNIVVKQSDPSSFFFIMVSARGMNKMKKMSPEPEKQGEAKQSLGGSP